MNILLWLAYKGTNYSGFQVQPNGVTVCAVVQDAMQSVFGTRPDVKGCSRTDAGVHARRFALNFHYDGHIPVQRIPLALNARLPMDVRALAAQQVPDDFHARYAAHAKTYHYRLRCSAVDDPFDYETCHRSTARWTLPPCRQRLPILLAGMTFWRCALRVLQPQPTAIRCAPSPPAPCSRMASCIPCP